MTINELREQLENGDESIPRKIINVAANLPNTEPFWRDRHKDVYALNFFMLHIYKSLVSYFRTDSMAEHLWRDAHKLLIEYTASCTNVSIADIEHKFYTDHKYKHQLIQNNSHLMTCYFANRQKNYNNTVVKETLQYQDAWGRHEFAKSRGQIHGHGIFFSPEHYRKVKAILDQAYDNNEKDLPEELRKWFQTDEDTIKPNDY